MRKKAIGTPSLVSASMRAVVDHAEAPKLSDDIILVPLGIAIPLVTTIWKLKY